MNILFKFNSILFIYFLSFFIFKKKLYKLADILEDLNPCRKWGVGPAIRMGIRGKILNGSFVPMNTHCYSYSLK